MNIELDTEMLMALNFLDQFPFHSTDELIVAAISCTAAWVKHCDKFGLDLRDFIAPFGIPNDGHIEEDIIPGLILVNLLVSLDLTLNHIETFEGVA